MFLENVSENKDLESQMVASFMSSNFDDEIKELYKKLKVFYDYLEWDILEEKGEKLVPLVDFFDEDNVEINVDTDCRNLNVKKYLFNGEYLIIKDIIFNQLSKPVKGYFNGLFSFNTLCRVVNDGNDIVINKLVSREIDYNGVEILERTPIYYGENFIKIDNLEEEKMIRKVLAR